MFYLGCHMADLVCNIMGMPDEIHAYIKRTGFDGVDCQDFALAAFEYPHGVSIVEAASTEVNGYGRRQLVVCGSEGTYEIMPLECPMKAYLTLKRDSRTYRDCRRQLDFPKDLSGTARYDDLLYDFAAMVRGEKENPYSFEYELNLHRIIMYCCGAGNDWKTPVSI